MAEWKEYELNQICSRLSSGKGLPAKKISDSGKYPVYGGNGLRGYTETANFEGDCAIIGRQGAYCGNVRYFSGTAYMTEHAVVTCANENNNTRYLSYLLSTMNLGRLSGQSAQPGLSVKTLGKQVVKVPPLTIQNKIVSILAALDTKIEDNEKINKNLAALDTFAMEMEIFLFSLVFSVLLITIFKFGVKANRNIGEGVVFKKPEAFTRKQKTTLTLMIVMMIVVLAFPLLKIFMPSQPFIKYMAGKIDVGLVAIIFAVIALLLDLAPQKEAIAKIPWNTIVMIAGAGMLIAVAVKAGTITMLSNWVGSNVPKPLIPIAFSIIGAIMSFFSSTTGVVTPALFPLIPGLASSTGIAAPVLFACTVLGAQSSAISPFSSGGSLILGSSPKEEDRNELFNRLLLIAVPTSVICCALFNFVVAFIF